MWCAGQGRCVYEALCSNTTSECPPPVVTRVSPCTCLAGRDSGLATAPLHPHRPKPLGHLDSANSRSIPRRARWVAAFESPSLGPIWGSEQRTSGASPWRARTASLSRSAIPCPPGERTARSLGSIGWAGGGQVTRWMGKKGGIQAVWVPRTYTPTGERPTLCVNHPGSCALLRLPRGPSQGGSWWTSVGSWVTHHPTCSSPTR